MSSNESEVDRRLVQTLVPELSEEETDQIVAHIQAERDARRGGEPAVVTDADAPTWQGTD